MTNLIVNDLAPSLALDRDALVAIRGGSSAYQDIANGGAFGFAIAEGGGILSPTINVQTIVNTPINVQLTNILKQIQAIDTTTIVASMVGAL